MLPAGTSSMNGPWNECLTQVHRRLDAADVDGEAERGALRAFILQWGLADGIVLGCPDVLPRSLRRR